MTSPADAALQAQLRRSQSLGFLGPGPIAAHIEHAAGFRRALADVAGTVVDLGSGGGVPGLVLAVVRPDLALVLLEASARRCAFLREACASLAPNAVVVEGRAEIVGRGPWRGEADAVVARSFAVPAATAECAAPLLRVGGRLVVSEPPEPDPNRWPVAGLELLQLELGPRSPGSPFTQTLYQRATCPDRFPRRDGQPATRPLF
jgi:16S rRNA (guanine527-N7)-methyltransferase